MRILLVADAAPRKDGWGVYHRGLGRGLGALGHEVIEAGGLEDPSRYLANPLRSYCAARRLARVIRYTRPDIVHIVAEPYVTLLPFLPRSLPPIVITVHGTYAYYPHLLKNPFKRHAADWLLRAGYARASFFVCVSEYTKNFLLAHVQDVARPISGVGRATSYIRVIPNGVDVQNAEMSQPKNAVAQFLFVGGVKLRKGVLEIVEAAAAYREVRGDTFHVSVVGSLTDEPWYVEQVRARIEALHLGSMVELVGPVSEERLAAYYRNADAFIMLNVTDGKEFEGFGLVFLEANAHGVPCVGAITTAAEEAIREGESGYRVDAHDGTGAAAALGHIVSAGVPLRASARRWAEAHSWERIAARYAETYENLRTR